jgi:hypothetical protein
MASASGADRKCAASTKHLGLISSLSAQADQPVVVPPPVPKSFSSTRRRSPDWAGHGAANAASRHPLVTERMTRVAPDRIGAFVSRGNFSAFSGTEDAHKAVDLVSMNKVSGNWRAWQEAVKLVEMPGL